MQNLHEIEVQVLEGFYHSKYGICSK